jgi:hypothetical protein
MASRLTFPDAPVDDVPVSGVARGSVGIDEGDLNRGTEMVDDVDPFAHLIPAPGATDADSLAVDLPVGSWFG